jgi:carboxymethylenebutenolidase
MRKTEITTRDGVMPVYVFEPEGDGPWPAAVMFMDAFGIRPAVEELAQRLSEAGYYVLLPDLFYRGGGYGPLDPVLLKNDPELRQKHKDQFQSTATPKNVMADLAEVLDFIAGERTAELGPVGVVGYCMGGRLALIAAGTYPDRIGVAASYHGGGLANDTPTSPHLLATKMKARVYVAGAVEDDNFPEAQKQRLEAALTDAGVDHLIETYPAKHGWVLRDNPVHDAAEAEHHWRTLIPLFDAVLKA